MRRILIIGMIILSCLVFNVNTTNSQVGQQGSGRLIFLCGQSSQQIMEQMAPVLPKIVKDQYGFIYLTYDVEGVIILFQFYNDRLQGLGIGASAPQPKGFTTTPYRAPKGVR